MRLGEREGGASDDVSCFAADAAVEAVAAVGRRTGCVGDLGRGLVEVTPGFFVALPVEELEAGVLLGRAALAAAIGAFATAPSRSDAFVVAVLGWVGDFFGSLTIVVGFEGFAFAGDSLAGAIVVLGLRGAG